MTYTV